MITAAVRAILRTNLGVRPGERVLVFTDRPTGREALGEGEATRRSRLRDLALMLAETARGLAAEVRFVEFPATGAHGKEPPRKVWEAALGAGAIGELADRGLMERISRKRLSEVGLAEAEGIVAAHRAHAPEAVIALSNYSSSHTRFRDLLTRVCGTRYASMPLFDVGMLEGPMGVDYKGLARRTRAVAAALGRAHEARITTPNGTEMRMGLRGRRGLADTGLLRRPGSFGNLPAGEAYLAPVEGTSEGVMVLEWAPTRRLDAPVRLEVRGGLVTGVAGSDPFAIGLERKLIERPANRNIAELGIGTNELARRPDNILESEKILGTIHMALGDNSSFGGRVGTPYHQDFVFFRPTVRLLGGRGGDVLLLEDGRLLV